jgi:hypothetical protein
MELPLKIHLPSSPASTNSKQVMKKPRSFKHIRKDLKAGEYSFRSKMEYNVYLYLKWLEDRGQIANLRYEYYTFWFPVKGGTTSYKPDFSFYDNEKIAFRYIEVKGYMSAKDRTKARRMKIYYPNIKIEIVDNKAYKAILRDTKGLINYE